VVVSNDGVGAVLHQALSRVPRIKGSRVTFELYQIIKLALA
jgi:hypothetical protein